MKLSMNRLQQIINEEYTMAKEFPPVSEAAIEEGPADPQQLLRTVDELGKIVSWAIEHSDDPEVVERMERADQMVTQLYSSVTDMLPGPGHDDDGYSKMAGTRPMEEADEGGEGVHDIMNLPEPEAVEPTGNPKEDALRQIVATSSMGKVEGQKVDLFSASAIVQVLDALSPKNKEHYLQMPVAKMAELAFKLSK